MKTLMHTCCAPCSVYCVESLRSEDIEPVSYWYNPNIHPYTEYRMRKTTLEDYSKQIDMQLIIDNDYGLRKFTKAVIDDLEHRCPVCYKMRLDQTAQYAAEHHYDSFTTTLLVSPYQKHDLLIAAGEAAAEKYGVKFLYRDFRVGFKEGQAKARELGLYMQKYCGCIFSEEERYRWKQMKKEKERLENSIKEHQMTL